MDGAEQIVWLPREALPEAVAERDRTLSEYFPDKRCEALPDRGGWIVRLRWPVVAELDKDPNIPGGLSDLFGGHTAGAVGHLRPEKRGAVTVCLNDSWTLLDWAEALEGLRTVPVVLIHGDAHSDLMSPLLEASNDGALRDCVTGREFSLSSLSSVESAIESGAVGIGSFVVPFLWQAQCEMVVHVCHGAYAPQVRGWGRLSRDTLDIPPFPSRPRPFFRRSTEPGSPGIPHLVTERVSPSDVDLRGKSVLVHVDLDFFNNRIDGDSHWHESLPRHDPPFDAMLAALEMLFDDLEACGLERCQAATIACSPEFCPAEHWASLVDALEARFARLRR